MEKLTFEDLPKAMMELLSKVEIMRVELEDIKLNFQPQVPLELMTRKEVANFFKIDLSTLYLWTKKGKLKSYGIGARVYYKRTEIEQTLVVLL